MSQLFYSNHVRVQAQNQEVVLDFRMVAPLGVEDHGAKDVTIDLKQWDPNRIVLSPETAKVLANALLNTLKFYDEERPVKAVAKPVFHDPN